MADKSATEKLPDCVWIAKAGENHNGPYGIWDLEPKRAERPGWVKYVRVDIAVPPPGEGETP